jgi:hypothetical protein
MGLCVRGQRPLPRFAPSVRLPATPAGDMVADNRPGIVTDFVTSTCPARVCDTASQASKHLSDGPLASMGGLWAGLAGAVWQGTWVAAVYGHPKASPGRAPVSEIDESSWQAAGASLVVLGGWKS